MRRRTFMAGIAASIAQYAQASPPQLSARPIQRPLGGADAHSASKIQNIIAQSGLSGEVAVALMDPNSNQIINAISVDKLFPPASVSKCFTTLYALHNLGYAHRFTTRVIATGPIQAGHLNGDLVIIGDGDPHLFTNHLADLVTQIHNEGVRSIQGRVKIWDNALPSIAQIDHLQPVHVGYNPTVGGLNLNFNRVYFEWEQTAQGYALRLDARDEFSKPPVKNMQMRIVERDIPVFTYATNTTHELWTVARGALGRSGGRWLPTRRPSAYAAEVFSWFLARKGIYVRRSSPSSEEANPGGYVIAQHDSAPLGEILQDMMKYSTNLTAEVLGLRASQKTTASVANLRTSASSMNDWLAENVPGTQPKMVDHSGLGGRSELSAQDAAQLLASPLCLNSLPAFLNLVSTDEIDNNSNIKIMAKTGSLNFVSNLAGYLQFAHRQPLAFAIFCADLPRRNALSRVERDRPAGGRAWQNKARSLSMQILKQWISHHG